MATRAEKIAGLTNQQALSILSSLAAETADLESPEGTTEQARALGAVLSSQGEAVDLEAAEEADPAAAAASARELLLLLAESPEVQPSLDEWLENPPRQEQAAVPLILAAPVVFSGCIAALYAVGHVRFRRNEDGTWKIDYRPEVETPMDRTMKDLASVIARLMSSLIPGKPGAAG